MNDLRSGSVLGRSPRTRGRRKSAAAENIRLRSIPAYAGETSLTPYRLEVMGVDPRVRGGDQLFWPAGSPDEGRSPRTRGRLVFLGGFDAKRGSIPAYAGETVFWSFCRSLLRVDPRVRGGDSTRWHALSGWTGRSPRTRGRLFDDADLGAGERSIPAYAGETASRAAIMAARRVDPRVRGGDRFVQR